MFYGHYLSLPNINESKTTSSIYWHASNKSRLNAYGMHTSRTKTVSWRRQINCYKIHKIYCLWQKSTKSRIAYREQIIRIIWWQKMQIKPIIKLIHRVIHMLPESYSDISQTITSELWVVNKNTSRINRYTICISNKLRRNQVLIPFYVYALKATLE